eukprot:scaffold66_cov233-Pinguiococcus_pyrenoidosus.AAC.13
MRNSDTYYRNGVKSRGVGLWPPGLWAEIRLLPGSGNAITGTIAMLAHPKSLIESVALCISSEPDRSW